MKEALMNVMKNIDIQSDELFEEYDEAVDEFTV